jgi:hypothetical protein
MIDRFFFLRKTLLKLRVHYYRSKQIVSTTNQGGKVDDF